MFVVSAVHVRSEAACAVGVVHVCGVRILLRSAIRATDRRGSRRATIEPSVGLATTTTATRPTRLGGRVGEPPPLGRALRVARAGERGLAHAVAARRAWRLRLERNAIVVVAAVPAVVVGRRRRRRLERRGRRLDVLFPTTDDDTDDRTLSFYTGGPRAVSAAPLA